MGRKLGFLNLKGKNATKFIPAIYSMLQTSKIYRNGLRGIIIIQLDRVSLGRKMVVWQYTQVEYLLCEILGTRSALDFRVFSDF